MTRCGVLLTVVLALFFAGAVRAAEFIDSFHAEIVVAKDGTLTVTETIRANAEGNQIRRGIYRDFPLTFLDDAGRKHWVGFDIVRVERDGKEEPYHTERSSDGIRIYFGAEDVFLSPGMHDFRLTYETTRQIRFFEGHDELFWNVTGTEWAFPIETATASVSLPTGVEPDDLTVFTGAYGATGKDANASYEGGKAEFITTRPLRAHEGLTIGVRMPSGSIDRPSKTQEHMWFLLDHLNVILAFAGLAVVGAYYTTSWTSAGRDPPGGVIVPRWDAPEGASPALVNYIDGRGFGGQGWTALSASFLNLAVKGYVVLEDLKQSIVATRTEKPVQDKLPTGEAVLMKAIGGTGSRFIIDKGNGTRVQSLGGDFRDAMEKEHRNQYYHANWGYIAGGIALSAASIAALVIFGNLSENGIAMVVMPVFISFFVAIFAVTFGRSLKGTRDIKSKILAIAVIAFILFVGLSILVSIVVAVMTTASLTDDLPLLGAIGGIILVNLLFYFLMGAPTPIGRKMMDGIEGLRRYLTLAEQDRMNMMGAPQMSPRHFETLLPYAVALGVEKPWTDTFERWLVAATAAGVAAAAYQPLWYAGDRFNPDRFSDRIGGFAGSMADSLTSSLPPPPKSSSSGFSSGSSGGGFSGGGGGGGGGGGW
ncbi:DUF2207 domain-containing protein [Sinorhizobium sp. BG8]|uniref:DUF2207 domain-containing protein n=1 Tax=Sinorhizobium sp. BG8 TaxID=2613773 RepID=UPI00193E5388|nr:DUF2207 domain-containing protein [Sinorhizobium sp. BG8]QRM54519.1 DUF2207 domain-containing protein [Sinorhizobium sp. BG8]